MRSTGRSRRFASVAMTGVILLAGLPSALSYSSVGLRLRGQPFLDVLDGTVGSYALPVAAVALVVIFVWVQEPAAVREQLGESAVFVLVKYVVPVVLIAVTGIRLLTGVEVGAMRRLPDLGMPAQGEAIGITAIIVAGFALVGWLLAKRYRRRNRERPED